MQDSSSLHDPGDRVPPAPSTYLHCSEDVKEPVALCEQHLPLEHGAQHLLARHLHKGGGGQTKTR